MTFIIVGILILIFLIATWLLLLSKDVASVVKSLEKQYLDLQSKVNVFIEQNGTLLTSEDIIEGYKKAYDAGLISKEAYKETIDKILNTGK